jgi:hypothetical protein
VQIAALFTDEQPPSSLNVHLREGKIELILAGEEGEREEPTL